jgi:CRISPR/Cas system-associated endonuclease/helicase Cas3
LNLNCFVLGIISTIKSVDFVIYLFILKEVLQIIHILSNHLQSKSATLGNSKSLITGVITTLQEHRDSEQHYNTLWNEMLEFSTKHDISLEIPLQCKKKYKNTEFVIYNYLFIWL